MTHNTSSPRMSQEVLNKYLSIPDFTQKESGAHAINLVMEKLQNSFKEKGYPPAQIKTSHRISNIIDEFDNLHIPSTSTQRSNKYTRYIDENSLLRSHVTPVIPKILKEIKQKKLVDLLVFCPGICYRRDIISKTRTQEPHKMDIWLFKKGKPALQEEALLDFVETIVHALNPQAHYRTTKATHPYTKNGLSVEIETNANDWLKLFECGQVSDQLLTDAGLNPAEYSGLGAGLGLDRCVMYIKKINDIRALRSENPQIRTQMQNLNLYHPLSYSEFKHTFTVLVPSDFEEVDACDIIRSSLGSAQKEIEQINFLEETTLQNKKRISFQAVFSSLDKPLKQNEVDQFIHKINRGFKKLANNS